MKLYRFVVPCAKFFKKTWSLLQRHGQETLLGAQPIFCALQRRQTYKFTVASKIFKGVGTFVERVDTSPLLWIRHQPFQRQKNRFFYQKIMSPRILILHNILCFEILAKKSEIYESMHISLPILKGEPRRSLSCSCEHLFLKHLPLFYSELDISR